MELHTPIHGLGDDLLTGAQEIAAFLGWKPRRVYYAAEKSYLPIKNIGQKRRGLLIARKSELTVALSDTGEGQ